MKGNNKTIIIGIIIAALLLMNSGKKEAIGDANWPTDCSFITNNNPYTARYTAYANAGIWISADINSDSVKEAFGYRSTATVPGNAGWTMVKANYNTYGDDIKTDGTYIYVVGSSGYMKFEKDYGAASNAILTCQSITPSYWCFQESMKVQNQTGKDGSCGLSYTGNWYTNLIGGPESMFDGNYGTFASSSFSGCVLLWNYTKPQNVASAIMYMYNPGRVNGNYSIPSGCFNNINIQLRSASGYYSCYDGSTWVNIAQHNLACGVFYEESMWWNINNCVPNWVTGSWTPATCPASCSQSRTVTDSNNCGTTAGMPSIIQSCTGGECIPTCTNLADDNFDCTITLAEVISFATKWVNNQGVTLTDVIESANIWVDGGTYTG